MEGRASQDLKFRSDIQINMYKFIGILPKLSAEPPKIAKFWLFSFKSISVGGNSYFYHFLIVMTLKVLSFQNMVLIYGPKSGEQISDFTGYPSNHFSGCRLNGWMKEEGRIFAKMGAKSKKNNKWVSLFIREMRVVWIPNLKAKS